MIASRAPANTGGAQVAQDGRFSFWLWTDLQRVLKAPEAVASAVVLVGILGCAVFADRLAPFPPNKQSLVSRLSPPLSSSPRGAHWLGTDQLGRDVLSRLVYGARVSLVVGLGAVALSGVLGVWLGVMAGYLGDRMDTVLMRLVDIMMAFPYLLMALAVVALLGPGLSNLIAVFTITGWPAYARLLRAATLSVRQAEFVESARSLGAPTWRVLTGHVLPNVVSPSIVIGSFDLARVIIAEATLSFFGVGVPAPTASWGGMISEGREYLTSAWWLAIFPGLALTGLVVSVNLMGDRLRDVLDPRLRD
jgi:peptide/nickel transport system permease protein